jgi:uncharacterized protein YcbX
MNSLQKIGIIKAIFRYPVKSMAGEHLSSAALGWHGIEGDRRYAFMRTGATSGFPWLTASKLPELITYKAAYRGAAGQEASGKSLPPVHVRIPGGDEVELESDDLRHRLTDAFGSPVELVRLDNGIFDDSPVSIISTDTLTALEAGTGRILDVRRFRPNFLVEPVRGALLREEEWVGSTLVLGSATGAPAVRVTMHDVRCVMVNLDPETAAAEPLVLKTIARTRNSCAGVYGWTETCGTVKVGDTVSISPTGTSQRSG